MTPEELIAYVEKKFLMPISPEEYAARLELAKNRLTQLLSDLGKELPTSEDKGAVILYNILPEEEDTP